MTDILNHFFAVLEGKEICSFSGKAMFSLEVSEKYFWKNLSESEIHQTIYGNNWLERN